MSIHTAAGRGRARGRRRRVVYVVGAESVERARVAAALGAVSDALLEVRALGEVPVKVTRESAAVVVLVESGHLDSFSISALRDFRLQDAATVLLLATSSRSRTAHQLAALARLGLDGLFAIDEGESLETLRLAAARHLANPLPWSVVHSVVPNAASEANGILAMCLRHGDRLLAVDNIAHWLQWDRKTIYRKVTAGGLRSIHDLINLGRLLHAAIRLDETQAPIGVIAHSLQFPSPSTLRRLAKRETGQTPKELRKLGAVNTTVAKLRTSLA